MKAVLGLLAGLLMISGAHAQSTLDRVAIHEGGGSIGNGGEIREIDLLTIIKKIKTFLLTEQGQKYFPSVNEAQLAETISKTKIQVLNEDLRDAKGNLRSARNIRMDDQSFIQFSAKSLAEIGSDEASLYVLVFHEYLNLMGIELSQDASVSSVYPVSSKLIPFVGEIEKIQVDLTDLDYDYRLICSAKLHVTTSKKNIFGKWVVKKQEDRGLTNGFGEAYYNFILRTDEWSSYDIGMIYEVGHEKSKSDYILKSKIESEGAHVRFYIGQRLLGETFAALPSSEQTPFTMDFSIQPGIEQLVPSSFPSSSLDAKETVDHIGLSCRIKKDYR